MFRGALQAEGDAAVAADAEACSSGAAEAAGPARSLLLCAGDPGGGPLACRTGVCPHAVIRSKGGLDASAGPLGDPGLFTNPYQSLLPNRPDPWVTATPRRRPLLNGIRRDDDRQWRGRILDTHDLDPVRKDEWEAVIAPPTLLALFRQTHRDPSTASWNWQSRGRVRVERRAP